jgi:hypothetical protein
MSESTLQRNKTWSSKRSSLFNKKDFVAAEKFWSPNYIQPVFGEALPSLMMSHQEICAPRGPWRERPRREQHDDRTNSRLDGWSRSTLTIFGLRRQSRGS